jgi:hypothetical protein
MLLAGAQQQGLVTRNVAEHITHVAARHRPVGTYTGEDVTAILGGTGWRMPGSWRCPGCAVVRSPDCGGPMWT